LDGWTGGNKFFFGFALQTRGKLLIVTEYSNVNLCWMSLKTVDQTGKGHQVCKYDALIIHEVIRIVQNARSLSFALAVVMYSQELLLFW